MAKKVPTVQLTHSNGVTVTVAESQVDTLVAQGFKKPGGKPRATPKSD